MSSIDDVLLLPDNVDVRLVCPDILVIKGIVPSWRDELIQVSENINNWSQSGQIDAKSSGKSYKGSHRTSDSLFVSEQDPTYGPCFRRFEEGLSRAYHTGARVYASYNPWLAVSRDTGYEMLRYKPGGKFGTHVDAVAGRLEGLRQLSGLIFLNDDYTGGELQFPRQGVKIKGEAGDLLLFPSNFCYAHASLPVTKGTKYAVVTWFVAHQEKPIAEEEHHGETSNVGSSTGSDADDERLLLVGRSA